MPSILNSYFSIFSTILLLLSEYKVIIAFDNEFIVRITQHRKKLFIPIYFFFLSDSGSESGSHKGGGQRKTTNSSSGDGKPTRVRTVLNEKQLHTLRTCYAANPRPDALMKEQLVEMTGLSPRVIRVWFQNKRCKDKKKTLLMKQQMQQEKVSWFLLLNRYYWLQRLISCNAYFKKIPKKKLSTFENSLYTVQSAKPLTNTNKSKLH